MSDRADGRSLGQQAAGYELRLHLEPSGDHDDVPATLDVIRSEEAAGRQKDVRALPGSLERLRAQDGTPLDEQKASMGRRARERIQAAPTPPAPSSPRRRGGPQLIPRPADHRPGPQPPWGDGGAVPVVNSDLVRAAMRLRATRGPCARGGSDPPALPLELPGSSARPAAVLCALFDEAPGPGAPRQAHVVLTRRSDRLRSHTGEVSFPGGRLDDGEAPLQAALREAREEIGLDPRSVEVLGQLSPLSTVTSRAAITPFVGMLRSRPTLHLNAGEVDRALMVPLVELWSPAVYHEERWEMAGGWHEVHFFDLVGDTVWGATARILRELLDFVWLAASG